MKYILIGVFILLNLFANTQTLTNTKLNGPPIQKTLIEDETWIMASGKTSFRIITSNDSIGHLFMQGMEDCMERMSHTVRTDRKGKYWERSFYFRNEYWNLVVLFVNNGFK